MSIRVNDNLLSLIGKTPGGLMSDIAHRVKQRRLEKGWTQKSLASKAGLSYPSYRRFESTGETSVRSLILLAFALDMTDEFESLFSSKTYQSMDELMKAQQAKPRKRGYKHE